MCTHSGGETDYISHNEVTSSLDVKHATTNLNEKTRRYIIIMRDEKLNKVLTQ